MANLVEPTTEPVPEGYPPPDMVEDAGKPSGIRVLHLMAGGAIGGAERFFERCVRALGRSGLDQHAVIRPHPARMRLLAEAGVGFSPARFGGPLDWRTPLALRREVRRIRPDVVLAWMSRAARFMPSGRHVPAARLGGYYDLKYYRRCRHLVGNTPDIRRYLVAAGWPEDRAHYLPNFVDDGPMPPLSRPDGEPVLLALGRLHRSKGFDVAVRALARLDGGILWLAGDGPERAALGRLVESLGLGPRVRFLGWRDDTAALLATADLLLCPSRHEPLGNTVIEAWAHHVPVVAAAADGPKALMAGNGAGRLVPADNPEALADAIREVLSDAVLRARLVRLGREAYEASYTETAVVRAYRAFLERIAADTSGR